MAEYKEGDRLRLENRTDGSEIIGYYRRYEGFDSNWYGPMLVLDGSIKHGMNVEKLLESGNWQVEVLERAPDPLPTVPGHYVSAANQQFDSITLDADGKSWFKRGLEEMDIEDVRARMPLTHLRPEVETARAVLYALKDRYGENYIDNMNESWNAVARLFGVK